MKLDNHSVISIEEAKKPPQIYAFVTGDNGHLYMNISENLGANSIWEDRGAPLGITLSSAPGVITYQERGKPREIYAFVAGDNGQLYTNFWDGGPDWKWKPLGAPPGTTVSKAYSTPGVITYREGTKPQQIYVFVTGENGQLYMNFWDGGPNWKWEPRGTPLGTKLGSAPGVITYQKETQPHRIYAFTRGANGYLYVNFWKGGATKWEWADQNAGFNLNWYSPGVVTLEEIYFPNTKDVLVPQTIFSFVVHGPSDVVPQTLHANYWDGSEWKWNNNIPGINSISPPAAISLKGKSGSDELLVLVLGSDGHLHKFHWGAHELVDLGAP